jgi:NTP pyrophosphatase (non-canonical NTP hydrolase)
MLAEFHAALDDERGRGNGALRLTLHEEEGKELLDELGPLVFDERIPLDDRAINRAQLARELADVLYVSYGTAHAFDIDLDAALAEVHRAAMHKLYPPCEWCHGTGDAEAALDRADQVGARDPCEHCDGTGRGERLVREDGKILKPLGFMPPDMSAAIGEA